MRQPFKIDLEDHIPSGTKTLIGRPDGEQLLKNLRQKNIELRLLEKAHNRIIFLIPKRIIILNKSFFLGWLETRVQELGKKRFEEIYSFEADEFVEKKIKEYVDAALLTLETNYILNVN